MDTMSRPRWLQLLLLLRQSYMNPIELTPEYEGRLGELSRRYSANDLGGLGVFPIADERQSAEVIVRKDDSAVLFDVGQSAILKSAFAGLFSGRAQDAVFGVMLAAASLGVAKIDRRFAELLGDTQTDYYESPFDIDSGKWNAALGMARQYLAPSYQEYFEIVLDIFILAHEHYHQRIACGVTLKYIDKCVDDGYSEIVDIATLDRSSFVLRSEDPSKRDRYEKETNARRKYYMDNADHLKQEIACDLFALTEVQALAIEGGEVADVLLRNAALVLTVVQLLQLHAAVLDRAKYYVAHERTDQLPGDLGLFNLRRVALSVFAQKLYIATACESAERPDRVWQSAQARISNVLSSVYLVMAAEFLGPCTVRINGCLDIVEAQYPLAMREKREGEVDVRQRLWASAFGYRLDTDVLLRMFGVSAEQFFVSG